MWMKYQNDWKFQRHAPFISWILHVSPIWTVWIEVKSVLVTLKMRANSIHHNSHGIDVPKTYMVVIAKSISYPILSEWIFFFLCNVITLQQIHFEHVWDLYALNDGTNQVRTSNNRRESKRNIYLPPSLNMVRVLCIHALSLVYSLISDDIVFRRRKMLFPLTGRQTNIIISYTFWLIFRFSQWVFSCTHLGHQLLIESLCDLGAAQWM